jgi:hypothetical protein
VLPSRAYSTAKEWYITMADMHVTQIALQRNDAIEDEDAARDRYVACHLFRTRF